MDDEDELLIFLIIFWYVRCKIISRGTKRNRDLTSALSGHAYTQELLVGSNTQCHELMRLSRDAYVLLCNHFKQKNWLQDSKHISVKEKIAIFLTVLAQNDRYRAVKYRFQHSLRTIHIYFHEVLQGMMQFAREIIGPTYLDDPNVSDRQRYLREMFPGAIGALDGTLLAICDFNMMFTFVWAGWEGIAHDSRILNEVVYNPTSSFPIPAPNKYYLCDAAYANTRGFLAPYLNTRYWLADF
ncbi:uncharacterized protein [Rutidosis leptorrhynchoides]|uniref:uncharacterized protein n=1 Tax=Rutidosis leptorrhynchoides TaxID=125765 RepID=UPI003A9920FB